MSFLSAIRVALAALLVNKGRSALTSLGIVIGISAVIAMVSAGSGARRKLDDRLESVGKNLILIKSGSRTAQGTVSDFAPLSTEDAVAIRQHVGHLLIGVAESQLTQKVATANGRYTHTVLVGSMPDLRRIRNWQVVQGRFYTEEDVKKQALVCLVGQTVLRKLFPDRPNPIGQHIRVEGVKLRVIGILGRKGTSPLGGDQDDQLFLPITTLQSKLAGGQGKIGLIVAGVRAQEDLDKAKAEIIKVLRRQHHLRLGANADFDVSSVQEMAELAVIVTTVMQYLIAMIAAISLVVGGIGIMNIMLVSVTERTREIGIRMAVGATGFDVLRQFLLEAVALSLVGGIFGISLGIAGTFMLARLAGWPAVVSPGVVAVAFLVAAGVGVLAGFYPALKASRLDPIESLRYE
ncbi:MAG TPA: ABC transporter permease [Gemmataceae bacterium]|nr:ABC transporter permease [Gemmataceae bacterium]